MKKWVLGLLLLSGCGPQRFFYYPNQRLYHDPDKLGIAHELVFFPSANGKVLTALFFPTAQKPKGTIVHFHGNFGNLTNHFPLSFFLVRKGFDVLIFDYQGYGASKGSPTRRRTIEDGRAAIQYAQTHLRPGAKGVCIFGQSLGGAVSLVAAVDEPSVRGLVIESAFASYRDLTRDVLGRNIVTWLLYPIYPLFIGRAYDPERFVARMAPRPLLFIHGTADKIVPHWMSDRLFAAANEPKTLWKIPGANHLECRTKAGSEYEEKIVEFFTRALAAGTTNNTLR